MVSVDSICPTMLSASELFEMVLGLHTKVLLRDEQGLRSSIHEYGTYILTRVPLEDLAVMFESWSKDSRVEEYRVMDLSTSPPIVLGCVYSSGKYDVIDGHHRAAAHYFCGKEDILAYVPG